MKSLNWSVAKLLRAVGLGSSLLALVVPVSARVLDDFNTNVKTAWADSDPGHLPPAYAPPRVVENQQFKFYLPPLGQSYFIDSTKTSETFELKEGRTIEFRVDLVSGYGGDSFAVLAWIPTVTGADSLAGYGLAKSETDLLITKGINKYFFNETVSPAVKNNNVTLVLNLKVKNGNVIIRGQVLDKDANNAVLFDKTFVDTPAADVMADGADSPPAPFITTGNFVLYLYENEGTTQSYYEVIYDNAEVYVGDQEVIDDFNSGKNAWTDSDPGHLPPAYAPPRVVENQQFKFYLPPLGQSYFINSTKTSKTIELKEGERYTFQADMVSGYGGDSFAVLAWIPTATGADSLAGYGLAKSESDILVTKGINKYFYNENPTPAIKNNNITLVLELTVRGGNVIIHALVLDKDANDSVIFEKTFTDTPGADVMSDGSDSPPAPYITAGNIVLYLYEDNGKTQDHYECIYDNLLAILPPVGNTPPVISGISPFNGANFLPASTQISFAAADDKALADANISVTLNGTVYTTANGLALSGPTNNRTVTLGGLAAGQNYVALLKVVDADGVTTTQGLYFDTFLTSMFTLEIEDYNFQGGGYFNNPDLWAEGSGIVDNCYNDRAGIEGIDFHDTRVGGQGANSPYRTQDPVRMAHTLDVARAKYVAAGGSDFYIFDYDVGDITAGEWLNYTRDFAPGSYQVYLREAVVNFDQVESDLHLVTSDPTQPGQTVKALGAFIGKLSGFTYRNVPLTDATGNPVILRLGGVTTLRLHQTVADTSSSARYENYLAFQPVADPGIQRATVASVSPANGSTTATVTPTIVVAIEDRDTSVKTHTIQLQYNGAPVAATVAPTASGATVTYAISPLPVSGANNTAKVTFKDNLNVEVSSEWNFVITYLSLDAANRQAGPGQDRGFTVRMVQAPEGTEGLISSLERAEAQLAPNSTIPILIDTNLTEQVINMAQDTRNSGYFVNEYFVPGLDEYSVYTDYFSVEIRAWLELTAGVHRFGVVTDDGYKVSSGASLASQEPVLGYRNGTANETFEFVVPVAGLYPFRMIWYEQAGNAYAEWFSVDTTAGTRTLINDPDTPNAVKAYFTLAPAPALKLQSSAAVTGAYTDETAAVIDTGAGRITVPVNGATRFYRLTGGSTAQKIKSVSVESGNVVMTYGAP
jgi:hypothetical protein